MSDANDDVFDHHGGFPKFTAAEQTENFGPFVEQMRQLQDLAVSVNPPDEVFAEARALTQKLVDLLEPHQVPEGQQPAGRIIELPGRGSLLMLPWQVERFDKDGVRASGVFRRYHLGGNGAAHGGVLPLAFDDVFGMVVHASGRPISRTAFLHINYRAVTPLNTKLTVEGRLDRVEGRKSFVSARMTDESGKLIADCDALMVQLLPGQP